MTPAQNDRYDKRCKELWGELHQVVVKHMKANEDIDFILAMGALTAEMVHIIHFSLLEDDQLKFLEQYCASMRKGLKQTQAVEKLKALAR